jgi:hypothetical protein
MENARAFPSDEEMLTAIMSAVADEGPLRRAHRLHELLGHLNSAELAVLFDHAVQVDDRERRSLLLPTLLARWATLDPAAAAAAVRPYRDRLRAMTRHPWQTLDAAVDEAWTRAQPEPALAEAMAAPDAPWARRTAGVAIEMLAEDDPARQLDTLSRLPASRLRGELCEGAIRNLANTDSAAAEARLDLISDPRRRARVHGEVLARLAGRDLAAGLARLAELAPDLQPGIGSTQLVTSVLLAAGKKDSAAALAALDGLPEELRKPALGAVLVGWTERDPMEALEWAAANGVDVNEAKAVGDFGDNGFGSWRTAIHAALDHDRDKLLDWLRTQPASPERDASFMTAIWRGTDEQRLGIYADLTPEGRLAAVGNVLDGFATDKIDRAIAWVNSLPPGPERNSAIAAFANRQIENAPGQIATLADQWPAGPERDSALRAVATSVARNDPPQALDFARRVSGAIDRETAFASIANNWLGRDETVARAWLTATPELTAAEKRVILRQFAER